MGFSLPSIKCSAAPPCFRLLPSERLSNQIVERSSNNIFGCWEEPPNIWLMAAKNAFCRLSFEFWTPHVIEKRSKNQESDFRFSDSALSIKIFTSEFKGARPVYLRQRFQHWLNKTWEDLKQDTGKPGRDMDRQNWRILKWMAFV